MFFKLRNIIVLAIVFCIFNNLSFADGVKTRFASNKKIVYKVSFNGLPSGQIEWRYLGRKKINGRQADIVSVKANTKILKLLNLTSSEKVFLDSITHLPIRVERDVVFFGKKEIIEEIYNQEDGYVLINRSNSGTHQDTLYQDKPIHNILELLYFFPQDIKLIEGKWMYFNLPNQKVRIKMVKEKTLKINGNRKEAYFLIGRGAKRFNLWLDKEKRLPLRLDFISLAGKITILRKES